MKLRKIKENYMIDKKFMVSLRYCLIHQKDK